MRGEALSRCFSTEIRNASSLVERGATLTSKQARTLAIHSLECALKAADPNRLVRANVKVEESCLHVGDQLFDLSEFKHLYVLGGGKAGCAMAQAIEELVCDKITAGFVIVPYGYKAQTHKIEIHEASHPVPDLSGVEGTQQIIKIAEQASRDDLIVCLISGGGSSLMALPREGVTLQDEQTVTTALLKSGAPITEINSVRKHLSAFKGGWLAKKAYPATVVSLIISDVLGDPVDSIASGPTAPDLSSFKDAKEVLEKHKLWDITPFSVRKVFSEGSAGLLTETPKPGDPAFTKAYNFVIGNNRTATRAAAESLKSEGIRTIHFDEPLEGEAKQVGTGLANFASRVSDYTFSLPRPLAAVAGGETTVVVTGNGLGGRNQELALSAALHLKDAETCVIASMSTDGVDGPTDAAGAIIDRDTIKRSIEIGLNAAKSLSENDSYTFFSKLGDLIFTGPTGTNVNDVSVIIVL